MNEIAVIRRSADENAAALAAIRVAFPDTVDIHSWDHVRIERVDSSGQITAYLADLPMDELRGVFHLGAPTHGKRWPSREEVYVHQEREQSLLAALAACRHVKVVNRGAVLAWNRGVLEPPAQLRLLSRMGWRTPSVTQSFDLDGDGGSKLRDPEPEPGTQDLLVIGQRRHARAAGRGSSPALDSLIARTQLHMRDARLDLCTIPIALTDGGLFAFGLHAGVSADVDGEPLTRLLQDAVAS